MTQNARRKTISSSGNIIDTPYGPGRWHSPRVYTCGHDDCPNPATVVKGAGAHGTDAPENVTKTHNCCGTH